MAQPLDLLDQEVDVRPAGSRVGNDHAEEIDFISLWLVTHHGGTRLHHPRLDLWGHLLQTFEENYKPNIYSQL